MFLRICVSLYIFRIYFAFLEFLGLAAKYLRDITFLFFNVQLLERTENKYSNY